MGLRQRARASRARGAPLLCCTRWFRVTLNSVDEFLKCDHSNEIYPVVLLLSYVCYTIQGGFMLWVCGRIETCPRGREGCTKRLTTIPDPCRFTEDRIQNASPSFNFGVPAFFIFSVF